MIEQQKNELPPIEDPERDPLVGFDLRTEIYNKRTGKLLRLQPYIRHSDRDRGTVYEREGKFFYENGEEAEGWSPRPAPEKPVHRVAREQHSGNHKDHPRS